MNFEVPFGKGFDTRGDGYVKTADLRAAVYEEMNYKSQLNKKEMDLLMERFDRDATGEVTLDQFARFAETDWPKKYKLRLAQRARDGSHGAQVGDAHSERGDERDGDHAGADA